MKKTRKLLALLLAVIMAAGCLALTSAAKKNTALLLLGDSIAWGSGVMNSTQACYGRIVADTNGYDYANYAVPGHRTDNMLARLDRDNVSAAVENADIICISIGGNDYLTDNMAAVIATVKAGDMEMVDSIAANLRKNFAEIIGKIRALNPDAVVFVQTLYNPLIGLSLEDVYQQAIDRINESYDLYLADHPGSYEIIDVAGALDGKSGMIAGDSIHPSAKGNVEIAKLYLRTLKDMGLGTETEPKLNAFAIDNPLTPLFDLFKKILAFFRSVFGVFG